MLKNLFLLAIISVLFCSCSNSTDDWTTAVPRESSFIIVPQADATVDSVFQTTYLPFLEDITSSPLLLVSNVDSTASQSLRVESIILYPGADEKLAPIWILQNASDLKDKLKEKYTRDFTKNEYRFNGTSILRLNIKTRTLYVAQVNGFLFVSESSNGIENAIRTYSGQREAAAITSNDITPGTLIINTPFLDKWIAQLAKVKYHPVIQQVFRGTAPSTLTVKNLVEEQNQQFQFTGDIALTDEPKSALISALSYQNNTITLDQYISSNAAAFGIFHSPPPENLPETLPDTSAMDTELLSNSGTYSDLAEPLATEFGMVMYAESGFLSTGEYLFLRKLDDTSAFVDKLEEISETGLIEKVGGLYFVQSYGIAHLLSSGLSNFKNFYINITGDAAVLSKRKGLADLVASNRNRRRVVLYEPYYEDLKNDFPEQLSSLFVTGPEFNSFLTPFLSPNNYVDALTASFNYMALTTTVNKSENSISVNLSTFNSENGNRPFQENWLRNKGGGELSGPPTFGNVGGSYNDEVVYATRTGNVYARAADGTIVRQFNNGSDVPVGSPVVYDWYGTGQNVVLLAAGNKIYGWDEDGDLLPKFPFELSETITTPLTITDLNNNKLPDAIVGTADRKLHVLNGRGENLSGWPATLNTPLESAPLAHYFQGGPAIIAFSSNAVHAWNAAGTPLNNFPVFINASFRGQPALIENTILGNSVDGNLYAIGNDIPFADSLNVFDSNKSDANVKAVNISNNALSGTPHVHENSILTSGRNGSVFLLNTNGALTLTKSMGQPGTQQWSPFITDINNDGEDDIVALAAYGRLYAWQISNGERLQNLPTAAMNHLKIGDLDGDGLMELVAQTDKGVQCWTINR